MVETGNLSPGSFTSFEEYGSAIQLRINCTSSCSLSDLTMEMVGGHLPSTLDSTSVRMAGQSGKRRTIMSLHGVGKTDLQTAICQRTCHGPLRD